MSEFKEKEQEEIKRVEQMLEAAETIKTVARQSRIMPGGSLVTPNIIFATNKRLIIRDPTMLGLRAGIELIPLGFLLSHISFVLLGIMLILLDKLDQLNLEDSRNVLSWEKENL